MCRCVKADAYGVFRLFNFVENQVLTPDYRKTMIEMIKSFRPVSCAFACAACLLLCACCGNSSQPKPRILVSTDLGGPDEDDYQSMIHLLMFSDIFDIEGIVSTPTGGGGNVDDIKGVIDLFGDKVRPGFPTVDYLKGITRQGALEIAPYQGFSTPSAGSDLIVECARREDDRPLYILAWGGLDDIAQALHDAPEIASKIRVYWIGGPNKKFNANAYAYIAANFPQLWFIENNATYRGFIHDDNRKTAYGRDFYENHLKGTSPLADDFKNHSNNVIRMGDTPSVLYMMNYGEMNPADPEEEHWGGRFEKYSYTARRCYDRPLTQADIIPVFSVIEMTFDGPVRETEGEQGCCTLHVLGQDWPGTYLGNGRYAVRYVPKKPETSMPYLIDGEGIHIEGECVVSGEWPGMAHPDNYQVGPDWYSDLRDPAEFEGINQGANTVVRWRDAAISAWVKRAREF